MKLQRLLIKRKVCIRSVLCPSLVSHSLIHLADAGPRLSLFNLDAGFRFLFGKVVTFDHLVDSWREADAVDAVFLGVPNIKAVLDYGGGSAHKLVENFG